MKLIFKALDFLFFQITIYIIINLFKILNFVVSNLLKIFYSILFKLDSIISRFLFKLYFRYIIRFLRYICSLSVYIFPNFRNACRNYLVNTIAKVKLFFTFSKSKNKHKNITGFSIKNRNILINYKSTLLNYIVKRVCW